MINKLSRENLIVNGHISAEKKHYNCSVSSHCHDFFEIEYIAAGAGSYTIDGTDYGISAGTLYFMTPTSFHSVDMKNTDFYNVMFSADMCDMTILSRLFANKPTVIRAKEADQKFICALLDELCTCCDNAEYAALILETLVSKVSLLAGVGKNTGLSADILSSELFILENFKTKLTLSDAASHVHLSESHFSRKFNRETGVNFKEYLNRMRFEYARKLLIYSKMTVMEICCECGFEDYPNFVRRFRQNTGCSPLEYRKKYLCTPR